MEKTDHAVTGELVAREAKERALEDGSTFSRRIIAEYKAKYADDKSVTGEGNAPRGQGHERSQPKVEYTPTSAGCAIQRARNLVHDVLLFNQNITAGRRSQMEKALKQLNQALKNCVS